MATENVTVRKRPGMAAKSVRDMVLSLAAVLAAGIVIYLFIPHSGGSGVPPVQYQDSVLSARRAAPYPLLAPPPQALPSTWKATSVNFDASNPEAAVWTLGFIDPEGQYVAIEQSNAPADSVIHDATLDGQKTPATTLVNGTAWTHYQGSRYQAIVLKGTKGTTVVYGTETFAKLGDFAAKLTDH
ncbi:DUF4245 domain-containing protein [Streptacidiphilus melanogenes]|uniref:DUF4245 domain-containing protein n=1 Tax=Streptacidiphilus melanogenes TaxID=411235 RepID=UPI001F17C193|nr:DUF4245 domain-containing protein [Streptacidiphilus melanogenes]